MHPYGKSMKIISEDSDRRGGKKENQKVMTTTCSVAAVQNDELLEPCAESSHGRTGKMAGVYP